MPVGVSSPRAVERISRASDAATPELSPVPTDFRSHMARVSGRFVSAGHAERFDAVVWANDAARAAWDAAGDMPDGAMLVEEAIERTSGRDGGADRPAGLLVMEKGAGTWRFVAVMPAGEVVSDTRVALCAACHRDAPRDFVFRSRGGSSPQPQSSSVPTSAAMTAIAPMAVATMATTYEARSAGSADLPSSL